MRPQVMTPAQISIKATPCSFAPIGEDVFCVPVATGLPVFGLDDYAAIAVFVVRHLELP